MEVVVVMVAVMVVDAVASNLPVRACAFSVRVGNYWKK